MRKILVLLLAIALLASCKKDNEPKFTKVTITKVTLSNYPITKASGSNWDDAINGTYPDTYYDITKVGTTTALYSSPFASDVELSDLPFAWTTATPYTITNLTEGVDIDLYDYDSFGESDYMGTVSFKPIDYASFPAEVTLTVGNLTFKVTLSWGT